METKAFISIDLVATIDVPGTALIRLATLRYHPDGGGYGTPYSTTALLTALDESGWISGAVGKMTPHVFKQMLVAVRGFGLEHVEFERKTHGKRRLHRHLT